MVTKKQGKEIKRSLQATGVKYADVARLAGVSWNMVWQVINGRKVSSRVLQAIQRLVGNGQQAA